MPGLRSGDGEGQGQPGSGISRPAESICLGLVLPSKGSLFYGLRNQPLSPKSERNGDTWLGCPYHSGNCYLVSKLVRRCLTPRKYIHPPSPPLSLQKRVVPDCWGTLCESVSLSFLTNLRHSLIGFNKISDGQLAG